MNSLLKASQSFYRASQDTLTPVKNAVEEALRARFPDPESASIKSVSVIDKQVRIVVHLDSSVANQTNRTELTKIMKFALSKINPSLLVEVLVDLSSEETVPKTASFRKYLKVKLAQDAESGVRTTVEEALKGIPDSKLSELSISGLQVNVSVQVPQQHSFTASQLGDTLTKAIQSVLPGGKVNVLLNFETKTASRKKRAQDTKAAVETALHQALANSPAVSLTSFVYQPETKHVLVEIAKAPGNNIHAQQVSNFLTKKLQAVVPGVTAIATLTS